ncbi:uncharacterized protein VP01_4929g1, partial [Puccinia sorghi]
PHHRQMSNPSNSSSVKFSKYSVTLARSTPLVESLFLQILVPAPPNMSRSQRLQNILIQLSGRQEVTARDVQVIINSAYGESTRFDTPQPAAVSLLQTTQAPTSFPTNSRTNTNTPCNLSNSAPFTSLKPSASGNVGCPGHPTANDVLAAINNICRGNHTPPQHVLSQNSHCNYCSGTGNWHFNFPVLRRDAFLPPPQDSSSSVSAYAQPPAANRSIPTVRSITGTILPEAG